MTTSHRSRTELTKLAEHLDLKTAAERKIKVGYTPDVLTDAGMICFSTSSINGSDTLFSRRYICDARADGRSECERIHDSSAWRRGWSSFLNTSTNFGSHFHA